MDTDSPIPYASARPDNNNGNTPDKVVLFSIVTITYNAADVVVPTLRSLNAQTFRDFEHIVIDGASSDRTTAVVSEISPDSFIASESDHGLYDAMNKGLRRARGRYVLFLNAGDSFHTPRTLELYAGAVSDFQRRHGTGQWPDIIYGDTVIVNSHRQVTGPRHLSAPDRLTFRSFSRGMLVCHQSFMARRDIAPEYDLRYRFSADYEWTLRCIKASDPTRNINLHSVVTDYLSDGLTDRNHRASLLERFRIMTRYYGIIPTIWRHVKLLLGIKS